MASLRQAASVVVSAHLPDQKFLGHLQTVVSIGDFFNFGST